MHEKRWIERERERDRGGREREREVKRGYIFCLNELREIRERYRKRVLMVVWEERET